MTTNSQHGVVSRMGIISALVPLIAVVAALVIRNLLILDYVHILLGAIWTGVDVFFGVIFRLIFRELSPDTRASVAIRMTPATLFFMPTASILTPLVGYYLAIRENVWDPTSGLFTWIFTVGILLVVTGFLTVFPSSLLIARSGKTDDVTLKRRLSWISNGALIQLAFQIVIISLMAVIVVFH